MISLPAHTTLLTTGLLVGLLTGCESAPPPSRPRNPTTAAQPAPTTAPTTPAGRPATEPAQQPTPSEAPVSAYLTVLEPYDPQRPVAARGQSATGNRLIIDTRNVRRLRIDRDALPLRADRHIVLQLDGQGFEWLAGSQVTEFERSDNGVWSAVKPNSTSR